MPINFPSNRSVVIERVKTDIQNTLQGSNPWLRNSWLLAMCIGIGGRIYDFYYQLMNNLMPNVFPWTAISEYLQRWGGWVGLNKTPATQSSGIIAVTGGVGETIPSGSELQTSDGATVKTQADSTIALEAISIMITRSGTLATAETASPHKFSTGQNVTISGATQTQYNGIFNIVVVDDTHFTFAVAGSPATPATGTIVASSEMAQVEVLTDEYGASTVLESGDILTFTTPITGIHSTAYVGPDGVLGGNDVESDDNFRSRVQERYKNPVALFNEAAIIAAAKTVSGVTRVWVESCTPDVGEVTIYFVCDNQDPIIPTAQQISDVKDAILTIKPANVSSDYVYVLAPTIVSVDFVFTSLSPDTFTMREAIEANLAQSFKEDGNVGENFSEYTYLAAIKNTVDTDTGDSVINFALTSPTSDISISAGQLATLGTITFPV